MNTRTDTPAAEITAAVEVKVLEREIANYRGRLESLAMDLARITAQRERLLEQVGGMVERLDAMRRRAAP